ncbi:hypothetical protein [Nonomuraea soli]|uniref:Uncharacterized protein n=1 Tax=Nonomuraea soli TaxID=1032476 RepID=A0A7W0CUS3_9ACTN|nr:hypothetical protein [Nonomuraea soli]MBA2897721.1 hypothetical protein [Nonomuraea soli]
MATRRDTRGDAFGMDLAGVKHTKRPTASTRLAKLITEQIQTVARGQAPRQSATVGELGGFAVTTRAYRSFDKINVEMALAGVPRSAIVMSQAQFEAATEGGGLIQRLENRLGSLERLKSQSETDIVKLEGEIEKARGGQGGTFENMDALLAARERVSTLKAQVNALAAHPNFDAEQIIQALDGVAGATSFVKEAGKVTFTLPNGRTGVVVPGGQERAYTVQVYEQNRASGTQCPAATPELPATLRTLAGEHALVPDVLLQEVRQRAVPIDIDVADEAAPTAEPEPAPPPSQAPPLAPSPTPSPTAPAPPSTTPPTAVSTPGNPARLSVTTRTPPWSRRQWRA